MQVRIILLCLFCMSVSGTVTVANAQSIVSDSEKQKQWKSMENGPWDFAPDWYYFFLHKKYSGAEMYWKWDWFNSGFRVRFKEPKSDVKRIMPVRVTAEETQRQKIKKVESAASCRQGWPTTSWSFSWTVFPVTDMHSTRTMTCS